MTAKAPTTAPTRHIQQGRLGADFMSPGQAGPASNAIGAYYKGDTPKKVGRHSWEIREREREREILPTPWMARLPWSWKRPNARRQTVSRPAHWVTQRRQRYSLQPPLIGQKELGDSSWTFLGVTKHHECAHLSYFSRVPLACCASLLYFLSFSPILMGTQLISIYKLYTVILYYCITVGSCCYELQQQR